MYRQSSVKTLYKLQVNNKKIIRPYPYMSPPIKQAHQDRFTHEHPSHHEKLLLLLPVLNSIRHQLIMNFNILIYPIIIRTIQSRHILGYCKLSLWFKWNGFAGKDLQQVELKLSIKFLSYMIATISYLKLRLCK